MSSSSTYEAQQQQQEAVEIPYKKAVGDSIVVLKDVSKRTLLRTHTVALVLGEAAN